MKNVAATPFFIVTVLLLVTVGSSSFVAAKMAGPTVDPDPYCIDRTLQGVVPPKASMDVCFGHSLSVSNGVLVKVVGLDATYGTTAGSATYEVSYRGSSQTVTLKYHEYKTIDFGTARVKIGVDYLRPEYDVAGITHDPARVMMYAEELPPLAVATPTPTPVPQVKPTLVESCPSAEILENSAKLIIDGTLVSIDDQVALVNVLKYEKGYLSSVPAQIRVTAQGFSSSDVGHTFRMILNVPWSDGDGGSPHVVASPLPYQYVFYNRKCSISLLESSPARFSLNLEKGWNLVSVPVGDYNQVQCIRAPCYAQMPVQLVSNTCGDSLRAYSFDRNSQSYAVSSPRSGWDSGRAYWVKVSSACQLSFSATTPMTPEKLSGGQGWALQSGWNDVGAPFQNVEFSKVSGSCDARPVPWRFNTAAFKWERAQVLKPGEGYFLKATSACTLGPSDANTPPQPPQSPVKLSAQVNSNVIQITLENTAEKPVYYQWCGRLGFLSFEKKTTAGWVPVDFGYGCAAMGDWRLAKSVLEADGSRVIETVALSNHPTAFAPGTYRAHLTYAYSQLYTGTETTYSVDAEFEVGVSSTNASNSSRQLTYTQNAVYNLIDFTNVNGHRLAIYWKRLTDGTDFGQGSIESLDVDAGKKTTLMLYNGLVASDGKYLTYVEGNCVRYRELATNVEKTAECGGEGAAYRDFQEFVPVSAGGSIYYADRKGVLLSELNIPFNLPQTFPVYAYNLATGQTRLAFRVNHEFNAVSDGKTLAWTDPSYYRSIATGSKEAAFMSSEEGPRQVYHYDPATDVLSMVPSGQRPQGLSVSGNHIAFGADWAPGMGRDLDYNALYAYNVDSKLTAALTATDASHINLDSDGNQLVWEQGGSAENDQIWLYDYLTGEKRQLTKGAVFHSTPKVLEHSLVYSGGGTDWKSNNLFLMGIN